MRYLDAHPISGGSGALSMRRGLSDVERADVISELIEQARGAVTKAAKPAILKGRILPQGAQR